MADRVSFQKRRKIVAGSFATLFGLAMIVGPTLPVTPPYELGRKIFVWMLFGFVLAGLVMSFVERKPRA